MRRGARHDHGPCLSPPRGVDSGQARHSAHALSHRASASPAPPPPPPGARLAGSPPPRWQRPGAALRYPRLPPRPTPRRPESGRGEREQEVRINTKPYLPQGPELAGWRPLHLSAMLSASTHINILVSRRTGRGTSMGFDMGRRSDHRIASSHASSTTERGTVSTEGFTLVCENK